MQGLPLNSEIHFILLLIEELIVLRDFWWDWMAYYILRGPERNLGGGEFLCRGIAQEKKKK